MPRSKNLSAYDPAWLVLSEAFASGRINTHLLNCASNREAQAQRLTFYGFRSALDAEQHPWARIMHSVSVTIADSTCAFVRHDGESVLAQSLSSLGLSIPQQDLDAAAFDISAHDDSDAQLANVIPLESGNADEQAQLIKDYFKRDDR
jgi:hypothetical protein